jgi:hypothetical protein
MVHYCYRAMLLWCTESQTDETGKGLTSYQKISGKCTRQTNFHESSLCTHLFFNFIPCLLNFRALDQSKQGQTGATEDKPEQQRTTRSNKGQPRSYTNTIYLGDPDPQP